LWRRLAPRSQPKSAANAMFALLLLPPLILLVVQSHWMGVLLALLVQGGLYGIHTVLRPLVAASVLPLSSLGQTLGSIATIGLLMMAAAPALGGVVMQNLGYQGLIASLLAVNLAALGFAVFGQFETHGRARWTQS
jgi:MFS family permease